MSTVLLGLKVELLRKLDRESFGRQRLLKGSVLGQHPNMEAMTNVFLLKSLECTNLFIIILPPSFSKLTISVTEKLSV